MVHGHGAEKSQHLMISAYKQMAYLRTPGILLHSEKRKVRDRKARFSVYNRAEAFIQKGMECLHKKCYLSGHIYYQNIRKFHPSLLMPSPNQLPKRQFGKNGPQVPSLGFGLMGLSSGYGAVP